MHRKHILLLYATFAIQFMGTRYTYSQQPIVYLPPSSLSVLLEDQPTSSKDLNKTVFDLSLDELLELEIITASKVSEPLEKTTATVHIVTAKKIHEMGARTVVDILRHGAGIYIGRQRRGNYVVGMRGVQSITSGRLLFLLNGHVLNDATTSSIFMSLLDDLPVEYIKRLEIVRGPGSALYGANAFLGIINIITKSPQDIDCLEVNAYTELEKNNSIGQRYNALFGSQFSDDIGLSLDINIVDSHGPDLYVAADALGRTGWADTQKQQFDILSMLELGPLTFHSRYVHINVGDYVGVGNVLSGGDSNHSIDFGFIDIRFKSDIRANLKLLATAYLDHKDIKNKFTIFPAGSIPPPHPLQAWNGAGYIGCPQDKQTFFGGEIELLYDKIDGHLLMAGLSARHERTHDVKTFNNFNPGFLPQVQDVSREYNWMENADRRIWAIYLQDIWDLSNDLRLILGGRYDNYSDFGGTINPRIQLSWGIRKWLNVKGGYGTAFRAPDFRAQFVKNNPVISGNPDLEAEHIQTYEGSLGMKLLDRVHLRISCFHSDLTKLIDVMPQVQRYENIGKVTVDGLEIEAGYHFLESGYLTAAYSYVASQLANGDDFPNIPNHKLSLIANYSLTQHLNWNINTYWQGDSPRTEGDIRDSFNSYIVVNTTLLVHNLWKNLELRFSVYNLFNEDDYAYPSDPNTIPGDYPAPGRTFAIGFSIPLSKETM